MHGPSITLLILHPATFTSITPQATLTPITSQRPPVARDQGRRTSRQVLLWERSPPGSGKLGKLSLRLLEMEPESRAPSHALLLSGSPSWGARSYCPRQRSTIPRRLALIQATGSSLRGRAPSGDAPGGLLGALLLTRDPPLAGELRGCAGSPLQPQVPEPSAQPCGAISPAAS